MSTWLPKLMKRANQIPRTKMKDAVGICRVCFEVTEVLRPCCGSEVEFNSIIFRPEDIEDEVQSKNSVMVV